MSGEASTDGHPEPGTWGAFMPHAFAHGVTVETLYNVEYGPSRVGSCQYLQHIVDGEKFTYVLPEGVTDTRPLGFGRLVPMCKRLKIPTPKGWPINF